MLLVQVHKLLERVKNSSHPEFEEINWSSSRTLSPDKKDWPVNDNYS